ncbi:MAG: tetratricopeptide repeat protein [Anaerolineales bacterium]|nr:tetratricopeptide repeat protein [Anaerolineales bacterium]
MNDYLQQAIEYLKAGEKDSARKALVRVIKQDPNNEKAWLYMVACAANHAQVEASIRQLLRISPTNKKYQDLAQRYHVEPSAAPPLSEPPHPQNVKEALDQVHTVLQTTSPPQRVHQPRPIETPEEEPHGLPALVRRLWFWVVIAVLIIVGIITASTLNNEQVKRHELFTITAEAALIQGSEIAVTNAAIVATVERSATHYWATEAFYQATQQPVNVILQDENAIQHGTFKRGEVVYVRVEGTLPDLALSGRVSSNGVVLLSQEGRTDTEPILLSFEDLPVGELRLTIFLLGQPIIEIPLTIER